MATSLYIRLSALFFLQFFLWGSWFVTLGNYLLHTLAFSGREVGLIYGATAIAATISPFLLGWIADRFVAAEKILSIAHLAGGVIMFGLSFTDSFPWFYPGILLYFLFYTPTFALSTSLSFHHLRDPSQQFPSIRVWGTLGWILAGWMVSLLQLEYTMWPLRISAAVSVIQALYCWTLPPTPPRPPADSSSLFGPEIRALLNRRTFLVLIISLALMAIPAAFYYSFVNPYLNELGFSLAAGKMTLGQVAEIFLMLALPWFFSRLGFKWVIFIGLLSWGIRYALFALGAVGGEAWSLYAAILLHAPAYVFTFLSGQIYVDRKVPVHLRSTAQGFIALITLGAGTLIGTALAGELVGAYSLPEGGHDWTRIWAVPAAIGFFISFYFLLAFRKRQKA